MYANGSSTLVQSGNVNIVVDTLGPWDKDLLVRKLKDHNVTPEDVDIMIGTHLHTDHIGNMNLFTKSLQIVGDQSSQKDLFEFDIFGSQKHFTLAPNVDLYFTPGHTSNDVSVVVYNVDRLGTVAITGDLFESQLDLYDDNVWKEAGSFDCNLQKANREMILQVADFIVPGHGEMFKVK